MGSLSNRDDPATVRAMSDAKVRKLWAQVEAFRQLDPEIPSQIIATFLLIAMNPGTRILVLSQKLGLSTSATGRNVERLTSRTTKSGIRGLGFVKYHDDDSDYRAKLLHLTAKGEEFLQSLFHE